MKMTSYSPNTPNTSSNASVHLANNRAELESGTVIPTNNPGFACTKLPPHWRTNKGLPEPFRLLSLTQEIPNGTIVSLVASNENVTKSELKNSEAVFHNNIARFNDLRFIGKSGRGTFFDLQFTIQTRPTQSAIVQGAIKVTVDGPRGARSRDRDVDDHSPEPSSGPDRLHRSKDKRQQPYKRPTRSTETEDPPTPQYDQQTKPSWPILDSFCFMELTPSIGCAGDLCACVLKFDPVDKVVNIGFGLLFGAAVPVFEEDMETDVDRVRIKFRVPPRHEAIGDVEGDSQSIEVMALFKRGEMTYQANRRVEFRYLPERTFVEPSIDPHSAVNGAFGQDNGADKNNFFYRPPTSMVPIDFGAYSIHGNANTPASMSLSPVLPFAPLPLVSGAPPFTLPGLPIPTLTSPLPSLSLPLINFPLTQGSFPKFGASSLPNANT